MEQVSDQDILHLFKKKGNAHKAFNLIVNKYQERLYWHIRKIVLTHEDSNDVLQETFIKVFKNLDSFRNDSGLFTWMYRIASNEAISHLDKIKKKCQLNGQKVSELLLENMMSDPYYSGDEMQEQFQKALLTLPEKQRLVFNMKYFENMKYDEIAAILDQSVGGLKASYHHAVKKIETFIKTSLN